MDEQAARPSWNTYFLEIARLVSTRSTCLRRKVGAVLVQDKHIIATGYNGAPAGLMHCGDTGCLRQEQRVPSGQRHEICRGIHAEQNGIIQAARYGTTTVGAVVFCTVTPCSLCVKMLINAGIVRVVCLEGGAYPDSLAQELLAEAGLEYIRVRA